jgi:D-sedoheptulose 7-phosphate isomerase
MSLALSGNLYSRYVATFANILRDATATDSKGQFIDFDSAVRQLGSEMRACHDRGKRILIVGNGGSAGICSHMATDISKNGGMRATAFNDGAVLTCLGNDYGYEHVFAKQVEWHATDGDILVAISSSGRSPNILNAVSVGQEKKCKVVTLSGFSADNPLRSMGELNFFLASPEYGFVEVGHLTIMHAALDIQLGWGHTSPNVRPPT